MTLSIKALLPEVAKPEVEEKGKKRSKQKAEEDNESEMHEWKDDNDNGVSIAEMLGNTDNK